MAERRIIVADKIPMTREGYTALEEELRRLRREERPKLMDALTEARSHGDLEENPAYHDAKERQALLEKKISTLEDRLARAIIIEPSAGKAEGVAFGVTVRLKDIATGNEVTYRIVGEGEGDISAGKISITSPLARALVGRRTGERVEIKVPSGLKVYDILEVKS